MQCNQGVGVGILQTCAFLTADDWIETKVGSIGNTSHANVVSLSANHTQDGGAVIGVKRRRNHQYLRLVGLRDNDVDEVFVVDVRGVLNDGHFNALTTPLLCWIDVELREEHFVSLQIKTASAVSGIDGRERAEVGGRVSSLRISGEGCSVVRWRLDRVGQGRCSGRCRRRKIVEWTKNRITNRVSLVAACVARRTINALTVAGGQQRSLPCWREGSDRQRLACAGAAAASAWRILGDGNAIQVPLNDAAGRIVAAHINAATHLVAAAERVLYEATG